MHKELIMSLEVKTFCPLGSKCEEAKDGVIYRCAWYSQIRGTNKNTGEEVEQWGCGMNLMPMLMIENSFFQRATSAEVGELRKEVTQGNELGRQLLNAAIRLPNQNSKLVDIQ